MSSIVSEHYQFVIGVDTHAATHTFALVAAATGAVLDHAVFPTNTAGLSRAHGWLTRRVGDQRTLVVVEGTGSYGAIVTERWQAAGLTVLEAAKMAAGDRRGTGKSDELDAVRIARAVLGLPLASHLLTGDDEYSHCHPSVFSGQLPGCAQTGVGPLQAGTLNHAADDANPARPAPDQPTPRLTGDSPSS